MYPNTYSMGQYSPLNYGNLYQQPQYNPPQYQTPVQPIQQSTLVGRIINDPNEIRPNETPTTGAPAVFVKADGSGIFLTYMDQTGRIVTREYSPKETVQDTPQVTMESLTSDLAEIKTMLSQLVN